MHRFVTLAVVLLVLPGLLSCDDRAGEPAAGGEAVLLLAAASTIEPVTELAALFDDETGIEVQVTASGSNSLASQIMAGSPSEVFLSASVEWAEAVQRNGLAIDSHPLLGNRLVIVVPRGNPGVVASPGDLLEDRVRRVALAGENVPAGHYAGQALRDAGLYDALVDRGRIARGQNVRLTLGYVATGEAEAGVVYATDARASNKVEIVYTFPPESHEPIVYPLVLLKSSRRDDAGRRLYSFLTTPDAMVVFEKHGFSPASIQNGAAK